MDNNIETAKIKPNRSVIINAIVILVVIAAGVFLLKGTKPSDSENTLRVVGNSMGEGATLDTVGSGTNIAPITAADHVYGNPKGRIVIVEYSDTECPFCKRFHADMHRLVASNDEVLWVYRHFPIASLHPIAFREARATECAAEQGGNDVFWRYTNEIYNRTNSNNSLNPNELYTIAKDIGLKTDDFKTCLDSDKYSDLVQASIQDGSQNGVKGTPASFVFKDGQFVQLVPGALQFDQLTTLVDGLLQ
jgi:protein-disulfide isomerase